MGTIFRRGTRITPRFYFQYRDGVTADGRRRYTTHAAKGARTLEDARKMLAQVEVRIAQGLPAFEEPPAPKAPEPASLGMADLIKEWRDGLANRSAGDDRSRIDRHLSPRFRDLQIDKVTLALVMRWLDELRKVSLSGQTKRHLLNLLSRFFSWAIERGLATVNPVKMIPEGKRPKPQRPRDVPWLEDDSLVPALIEKLDPVVGLMFYLGNRSGLRTGEAAGLRMSDLEFLQEGVIRVRFSWNGPLKEDKDGSGKLKWVPAAFDAVKVLKVHLAQRKLSGAGGDDLVFPFQPAKPQNRRRKSPWTGYRKEYIEACWDKTAREVGVDITWYQATRHSFVSRNLKNGASLDEVSAALGHSSPVVTRMYYDHYVRKTFSAGLRQGIMDTNGPANGCAVKPVKPGTGQ
jgi:integrase